MIPTLKEELFKYKTSKSDKDKIKVKKEDEKKRRRATFSCIGFSEIWDKPIHSVIKAIQKIFGLAWLRVSRSYHRFTNLREVFQGDLSGKLIEGVESGTLETLECNCRGGNAITTMCAETQ
jgi:hypothetical protein